MKKIYLFVTLLVSTSTFVKAQEFVRIYNSSGKKIATGHLMDEHQNDSFLIIKKEKVVDTIPIQQISYIKTKHSIGNNILIGTLIGAPVGAIIGGLGASASNDIYDPLLQETETINV